MRIKDIGLVGAALDVVVGAAACGSSTGKATTGHPGSATTPTAARSIGPFSGESLKGALLDPRSWGSGWTDTKEGAIIATSGLGSVSQIPAEECWTAVYSGTRVGAQASVQDVVDSHTGDIAHQSAYQFGPGDATTMVTATAKRINDCGTFKHTDDNSFSFTLQASAEPVPGLGDQAFKTVVQAVNAQSGTDVDVSLTVRYGDVVIDVGIDSSIATTAMDYDLAGKAKAIAAQLGVTG